MHPFISPYLRPGVSPSAESSKYAAPAEAAPEPAPFSDDELEFLGRLGMLPEEAGMAYGDYERAQKALEAPGPQMHGSAAANPLEFVADVAKRGAAFYRKGKAKAEMGEALGTQARGRSAFMRRYLARRYGQPPAQPEVPPEELKPPEEM
ncbi:MAG TPA: hypothetical protein VFF02_06210 [Anaeromyxobacteraceae bacterium]|nr:hypothetical protein [Anaeromyxobacteraceae bacterium]